MKKKPMTLAVIAAVALLALGYVAGTWHANTTAATTTASSGSEKERRPQSALLARSHEAEPALR